MGLLYVLYGNGFYLRQIAKMPILPTYVLCAFQLGI